MTDEILPMGYPPKTRRVCQPYIDQIAVLSARLVESDAVIERLRKAGNWLSVCAQTSGGTSGRDSALVDAISDWATALARDALEKEGGE
jgi:hypothetical protein